MITVIVEGDLVVEYRQDNLLPLDGIRPVVYYDKEAQCEGCGAWIPMAEVCLVDERIFCAHCAKDTKKTPRHP